LKQKFSSDELSLDGSESRTVGVWGAKRTLLFSDEITDRQLRYGRFSFESGLEAESFELLIETDVWRSPFQEIGKMRSTN